jgi:F0F1-type ATP synthase membrane subunit b/b'
MNHWQRFRQSSITNKIVSVSGAVVALITIILGVAATLQYHVTLKMLEEIKSSSADTQKLANAAAEQANASQKQVEQLRESLEIANRQSEAIQRQANTRLSRLTPPRRKQMLRVKSPSLARRVRMWLRKLFL